MGPPLTSLGLIFQASLAVVADDESVDDESVDDALVDDALVDDESDDDALGC
jgi:hypothetical protein